MYQKIKSRIKDKLPTNFWKVLHNIRSYFRELKRVLIIKLNLTKIKKNHKKALEIVRKKEELKVAFLVITESAWKYEGVYRIMENNQKYNPLVIVCPYLHHGDNIMYQKMDRAYKYFINNNYNVIKAFNYNTEDWVDVKKEFKPDMVFFANPQHGLTKDKYYINNFLDTLTCYVPYSFQAVSDFQQNYNKEIHNYCWKYFVETKYHVEFAKKYSVNKGRNVTLTGYPGIDRIIKNEIRNDPWKIKDRRIKRIIWAPHHTFGTHEEFSNFFELSEFMLDLLKKYQNKIQIAFKPHPILKARLYSLKDLTKNGTCQVGRCSLSELHLLKGWDKERTDDYFKKWEQSTNGMLCESSYIDLFLTSDAMILDSISFITEYFYTEKPEMFVIKNDKVIDKLSLFAQKTLDYTYQGYTKEDIEKFIEEIVIEEKDYMKNDRINFLKKKLIPPNGKLACENIIDYLNKSIK